LKKILLLASLILLCTNLNAQSLLLTRSSVDDFDSSVQKVLNEKMEYIQSGIFSHLFESGLIVFDEVIPIESVDGIFKIPASVKGLASFIAVIRVEPDTLFAEAVIFSGIDLLQIGKVTAEISKNMSVGSKKESYTRLGIKLGSKILEIVN